MVHHSEIDDIFAGKTPSTSKTEVLTTNDKKGKNKKKTKGKNTNDTNEKATDDITTKKKYPNPTSEESTSTGVVSPERPKPQTVLDPSIPKSSTKSGETKASTSTTKARKRKAEDSDEERFKDSRGTGPRRKTEEGYLIYTEEELGINAETGGDTPLCPFDCNCCF
jgi:hypothetical protein